MARTMEVDVIKWDGAVVRQRRTIDHYEAPWDLPPGPVQLPCMPIPELFEGEELYHTIAGPPLILRRY